jgi:flagellin-like hook-associated protein FlgL
MMDSQQSRLSTGKRINTALDDNPVNYFSSRGLGQRAADLSSLKNSFGEAISTIKSADNAISEITSSLENVKKIVTSAKDASPETISSLQDQLKDEVAKIDKLANDSSYSGRNLLTGESDLTISVNERGTNSLTVKSTDLRSSALGLDTLSLGDPEAIDSSLETIDSARKTIQSTSKTLSTQMATITTRQDFTNEFSKALVEGASKLTMADLNEEGANMLALQTRQQLGTISLSLASQSEQAVMNLFR